MDFRTGANSLLRFALWLCWVGGKGSAICPVCFEREQKSRPEGKRSCNPYPFFFFSKLFYIFAASWLGSVSFQNRKLEKKWGRNKEKPFRWTQVLIMPGYIQSLNPVRWMGFRVGSFSSSLRISFSAIDIQISGARICFESE